MKKAGTLFLFGILLLGAGGATAIETGAKQVILIEFETGAILYQKAADEAMFPASMTKMMTAYLLFERLKNGTLSLEDKFRVSEEAWRKGGSKMFVKVGDRVTVEDLIRGIVVQSGNDATIVVAEGLSVSERAFADIMTQKARELGMSQTTFRNASGWPDPEHVSSARDLATLYLDNPRLPGILSLLFGIILYIQQDKAGQPQPPPVQGYGCRWLEDRLYPGIRLRFDGIRNS